MTFDWYLNDHRFVININEFRHLDILTLIEPKDVDNYPDISLGLKNQLIDSYFNGLMNDNSICEFSIKDSQINKSIRFRYDPVTSLQIRDL